MDIRILESHACNFNVVREHPAHLFSEEPTNAIIETDVELKKKKNREIEKINKKIQIKLSLGNKSLFRFWHYKMGDIKPGLNAVK